MKFFVSTNFVLLTLSIFFLHDSLTCNINDIDGTLRFILSKLISFQ